MIVGFEQETKPLTQVELEVASNFLILIKSNIGREKRITAATIEMHYRNRGIKLSSSSVRAIIHHIRYNETITIGKKKYFLISDNSGYWLSNDKEEITKYAESLRQRAGSILTIKQAVDAFLGIAPAQKFLSENQGKLF